jgi:hypothetical protein
VISTDVIAKAFRSQRFPRQIKEENRNSKHLSSAKMKKKEQRGRGLTKSIPCEENKTTVACKIIKQMREEE